MRMRHRIGIAVAVLAMASCAPKQRAIPEPRPPRVERPAERALPAAAYVARAASIDLYQVRAGELALQRSGSESYRSFARRMIEEHRGLASQLSMAGRRLNLLPSNSVQPEQQGWLDQLAATSSAAEFDAAYRRQQLVAHEASYRAHYAFAFGGDSPTLRLVARSAAGIEQDHERQMRAM
jgi:predicted outer membrane protein